MPFCACNRRLLTNGQIEKKIKCDICQEEEKQKEHAKTFKNRFEALQKGGVE